MRALLTFAATVLLAGSPASAAEVGEKSSVSTPPPAGLDGVVTFNEKLTQALCNEIVLSRPPSLEPLDLAKANHDLFLASTELSESQVLRLLMGDETSGIWSPKLKTDVERLRGGTSPENEGSVPLHEALRQAKRRFSRSFCNTLFDPPRLATFLVEEKFAFINLYSSESEALATLPKDRKTPRTVLSVSDSEGRTANLSKFFPETSFPAHSWNMAGWIEPFEILTARLGERQYLRVTNPLTNQSSMVLVLGQQGEPLGFLYSTPLSNRPSYDFNSLLVAARSPLNRSRQIEVYRQLLDHHALKALEQQPSRAEVIRTIQREARQSIDSAAQKDAPSDKQDTAALRRIISDSFLSLLKEQNLSGNALCIHLFKPDAQLEQLRQSTLQKLSGKANRR